MEEDGTPAGAEGGLPKLDEMSAGAEGGLPKLESTEPVLKQQQKKKPPKVEPHEGGSDLQQLVNTLSQALKQSIVASSEQSEVRRNVRAPRLFGGPKFQNVALAVHAIRKSRAHQTGGSSSVFAYIIGPTGLQSC